MKNNANHIMIVAGVMLATAGLFVALRKPDIPLEIAGRPGSGLVLPGPSSDLSLPEEAPKRLTYHEYLVDRVRREGEARAAELVWEIHEEILAAIWNSGEWVAGFQGISMQYRSYAKSVEEYNRLVAARVMELLNPSNRLEIAINRMIDLYLYELETLESWALQQALAKGELPEAKRHATRADDFLRQLAEDSLRDLSQKIRGENRLSARINAGMVVVTIATLPFSWPVALVEAALTIPGDSIVSSQRGVETKIGTAFGNNMETMADNLCFGMKEREGLFGGLLFILETRLDLLGKALEAPGGEDHIRVVWKVRE
ncbi:MAG TPA: hypothetical protein PKA51_06290 [Kiritimatiellia bacterium]|nr:hypothetical protein [Kiritimatiellia bacterium]